MSKGASRSDGSRRETHSGCVLKFRAMTAGAAIIAMKAITPTPSWA